MSLVPAAAVKNSRNAVHPVKRPQRCSSTLGLFTDEINRGSLAGSVHFTILWTLTTHHLSTRSSSDAYGIPNSANSTSTN
jgi:hypothetical protein